MAPRRLLPALVLGACSWAGLNFAGFHGRQATHQAMRGFKEDFLQWKGALTEDEKQMLLRQTKGEFDKKYRKTEEFSQDLPREKIDALGKVIKKYYESGEEEEYIKQRDAKQPDYEAVKRKCSVKEYDWSLTPSIIEVDRDAERMETAAHFRINTAKAKGESVPCGSPFEEIYRFKNDDEASHKKNLEIMEMVKKSFSEAGNTPKDLKLEVPPMGEDFEIVAPEWLWKQLVMLNNLFSQYAEENPNEDKETIFKEKAKQMAELTQAYIGENKVLKQSAEWLKEIGKSEQYVEGKTRSMWAKELHAEITKYNKEKGMEPPPPLDAEYLAEMDKKPCMKPDDYNFRSPWKTASKLYKSEAIDSFGQKYLLGVFPTIDEAKKVFDEWNSMYEEERVKMKEEVLQWGKQEQARLDKDPEAQERMRKAVEEARR